MHMHVHASGCVVIPPAEPRLTEGTRRYSTPIGRAMGARDIAQTVSLYGRGSAPARRNPVGEEVLYTVSGAGSCRLEGRDYSLAAGAAVYVPPGAAYRICNETDQPLCIVAVCCPEDDGSGVVEQASIETEAPMTPRAVSETDVKAIPTGDRTFKVLVDGALGCRRVTQFVGEIPPGDSPPHRHSYEEAIFILAGEGRVRTPEGEAEFTTGSSIYLPRGVAHALHNTGRTNVRLLGVFHPSGSPAVRYE
jgi:mannose-6-phosphate isomerase-like protein (cupin superfamily)